MEEAKAIDLSISFLEIAAKSEYEKIALSDPIVFGKLEFKPESNTSSIIYVLLYSDMMGEAIVYANDISSSLRYYLSKSHGRLEGFYKVILSELPCHLFSNPVIIQEPVMLSKTLLVDHFEHKVA